MTDEFVLSDEERKAVEASRAAKSADSEQPLCNCNAEGTAHRHTSNGIQRAEE